MAIPGENSGGSDTSRKNAGENCWCIYNRVTAIFLLSLDFHRVAGFRCPGARPPVCPAGSFATGTAFRKTGTSLKGDTSEYALEGSLFMSLQEERALQATPKSAGSSANADIYS